MPAALGCQLLSTTYGHARPLCAYTAGKSELLFTTCGQAKLVGINVVERLGCAHVQEGKHARYHSADAGFALACSHC